MGVTAPGVPGWQFKQAGAFATCVVRHAGPALSVCGFWLPFPFAEPAPFSHTQHGRYLPLPAVMPRCRVYDLRVKSTSSSVIVSCNTPEAISGAWDNHGDHLLVAQLQNTITHVDVKRKQGHKPRRLREGDEVRARGDLSLLKRTPWPRAAARCCIALVLHAGRPCPHPLFSTSTLKQHVTQREAWKCCVWQRVMQWLW